MKSRSLLAIVLLAVVPLASAQWQLALPGYPYQFPRDHFNHPEYQTEWWYYTGNLTGAHGHRYGFELTFFRAGIHPPDLHKPSAASRWDPDPIYLAHLAFTDVDNHKFFHKERVNRAGPGLAGASLDKGRIWNGNWQVDWTRPLNGTQQLEAVCDQFQLNLELSPAKPLVIQGQNGLSQKGPKPGDASHYLSFTRMTATGTLKENGRPLAVQGLAWMDHEFFTAIAQNDVAGWDWFSIQLDNQEEVMMYRIRSKSGAPNGFSSGTFVDAAGRPKFLSEHDFALQAGGGWHSPHSNATYPLHWSVSIPLLGLTLEEKTAVPDQELFSQSSLTPSYWEGAVTYTGTMAGRPVKGVGYLEMTGYDRKVFLAPR